MVIEMGEVYMSIEEKLKELIRNKYASVREFTIAIDMPYTTMDSIFRRGIGNSSVSNIIKICKALGISADALAEGEIVSVKKHSSTPINLNEFIEVKEILDDTKDALTQYGFVTLDGKPISKSGVDSIIDAMEVGLEIAKKKTR